MKTTLLKLILIYMPMFLCASLKAQKTIIEGSFYQNSKTVKTSSKGQTAIKNKKTEIAFTQDYIKLTNENKAKKQYTYQIYSCKNKDNTTYINNELEYAFSTEKNEITFFADFGEYESSKLKEFKYLEGDSIFNNMPCKKAIGIFTFNDNEIDTMTIWYTKDYRLKLNCSDNLFKNLKGFPLNISFKERSKIKMKIGGVEMQNFNPIVTISYDSITFSKPKKINIIANLEKYTKYEKDEFVNVMMKILLPKNSSKISKSEDGNSNLNLKIDANKMEQITFGAFEKGKKIPNFVGVNFIEEQINLKKYENKVLVINFWFINCKPCIMELPLLNNVKKQYSKNNDVAFLAITRDKKEELEKFYKTNKFDFEQLINAEQTLQDLGVSVFPQTIIIDKQGIIRFTKLSIFESEKELSTQIDNVLKNNN